MRAARASSRTIVFSRRAASRSARAASRHLRQQQNQAGAAGREEGQADAVVGQGVGDNGNVAEHLPAHLCHDANAHHSAIQRIGIVGDEQALHDEGHEQQDDEHRAHKAQLLTHHAEDEVVGALGEPELFLDAVAKAQTGDAA